MSVSEVFLSLQVCARYMGGFEQVSTCQVCFYCEAMAKPTTTKKKSRKLMYILMLLHTNKKKKKSGQP